MEGTPVREHRTTRLPKHWDSSSVLNGSHVTESTAGVSKESGIKMTESASVVVIHQGLAASPLVQFL